MNRNHWTILDELDPELNGRITAWRTHLVAQDQMLPRKYRELINVAMASIHREPEVILAHAKLAVQHGAMREELLATVEQVMTMGGFPSFRCAMLALDSYFQSL